MFTLLRLSTNVVTPTTLAPDPKVTGPLNVVLPEVVKSPRLVIVCPAETFTPLL